MAWYREWFGDEYLELYANRDGHEAEAHIDFVEQALGGEPAKPRPPAVLDLACGAGRHTAALRRRGYRALGVDLSVTLLIRGQVPCVAGDMRCLPFAEGSFEWVLNFFTSFGYFESERENFLVLGRELKVPRHRLRRWTPTKPIQEPTMRADGRQPDELRPITFERDFTTTSHGSVLVGFGDTRVLCTATVELDVPRWMRGTGKGWVTAEYSMLPGSSPDRVGRERRGPKGRTHEIERLIVLTGDERIISAAALSPRIRDEPRTSEATPGSTLPASVGVLERRMIGAALERHSGNKTRAAAELGISRRNLIRLSQRYGFD